MLKEAELVSREEAADAEVVEGKDLKEAAEGATSELEVDGAATLVT